MARKSNKRNFPVKRFWSLASECALLGFLCIGVFLLTKAFFFGALGVLFFFLCVLFLALFWVGMIVERCRAKQYREAAWWILGGIFVLLLSCRHLL